MAIKGIGAATVRGIVETRGSGRFTSIFDFASRLDPGVLNRRAIESLVTAGAFDSMMPEGMTANLWRAKLCAAIDDALASSQRAWSDRERGQTDLFGAAVADDAGVEHVLPDVEPWSMAEMSQKEKAAVGFFLSVHPLDAHIQTVEGLGIKPVADCSDLQPGDRLRMAGVVSSLQVRYSKKGNRFATFRFEDRSSGVKCLVWAEAYGKFSSMFSDDALLIIEGKVEAIDGQEITLIVEDVKDLADARPRNARGMVITLPETDMERKLNEIYTMLSSAQGRCDVVIKMSVENKEITLQSQILRVEGSARLERELSARGCTVEWSM